MPREDSHQLRPNEKGKIGSDNEKVLENYAQLFDAFGQYLPPRNRKGAFRKVGLAGPGMFEPPAARLGIGKTSIISVDNNPTALRNAEFFSEAIINVLPRLANQLRMNFVVGDVLKEPNPFGGPMEMIAALDVHPDVVSLGGLVKMAKMVQPSGLLALTKTAPFPSELKDMKQAIEELKQQMHVEQIDIQIPEFKHVVENFDVQNMWVFRIFGPR